jgi:hypothetical protein
MRARRVALLITLLLVALSGGAFTILAWDQASRLATVVSAMAAVAAVGVAVWAALPVSPPSSAGSSTPGNSAPPDVVGRVHGRVTARRVDGEAVGVQTDRVPSHGVSGVVDVDQVRSSGTVIGTRIEHHPRPAPDEKE